MCECKVGRHSCWLGFWDEIHKSEQKVLSPSRNYKKQKKLEKWQREKNQGCNPLSKRMKPLLKKLQPILKMKSNYKYYWKALKAEFISSECNTLFRFAKLKGISYSTLSKMAAEEKWKEAKTEHQENI